MIYPKYANMPSNKHIPHPPIRVIRFPIHNKWRNVWRKSERDREGERARRERECRLSLCTLAPPQHASPFSLFNRVYILSLSLPTICMHGCILFFRATTPRARGRKTRRRKRIRMHWPAWRHHPRGRCTSEFYRLLEMTYSAATALKTVYTVQHLPTGALPYEINPYYPIAHPGALTHSLYTWSECATFAIALKRVRVEKKKKWFLIADFFHFQSAVMNGDEKVADYPRRKYNHKTFLFSAV